MAAKTGVNGANGASPDLVLDDGRQIFIDMNLITIKEYRRLLRGEFDEQDEEDEVVARVAGLTLDELQNLPQPTWRRVVTKMFDKAREPLADPNSVSASTSG